MGSVNLTGFNKKMEIARGEFTRVVPLFIRDAATYINNKVSDEILNGQGGTDYPKSYPSGISTGAQGFVGIVTSNLRNSITPKKVNAFNWVVSQTIESIAPYHDEIAKWTKEKYGQNFYEIAIQLYGPKITKEFAELMRKYVGAIEAKRRLNYSNPFPR